MNILYEFTIAKDVIHAAFLGMTADKTLHIHLSNETIPVHPT